MQSLATFKLLTQLSLRNLYSHWVKTLIVGGIMLFGTFLVVLGTALLDSVQTSMAKSITSSLAGHLQVFDKGARDALELFGGMSMAQADIGRIKNYERIKESVSKVPNVAAVIPMGIDFASVSSVGELDRALGELRGAVGKKDAEEMVVRGRQVQQIAKLMYDEQQRDLKITQDKSRVEKALVTLDRVRNDAFWNDEFTKDPTAALEHLDTEVAPLAQDGKMIYLRYLGTDLDLFAKNFDRFEIVKGQAVPTGKRGFLFNEKFYEDVIKHRVARELDFIRTSIVDQSRKIEEDGVLKARVSQLPRQYQRVMFQLDAEESAKLEKGLREAGFKGETLDELLKSFLNVDETNIAARHAKFYELIAPMLQLYEVNVGDSLTIRSYTKSGYMKAVNVKVYGIFHFKGLERSDIAGGHNLMDMLTFRDLYGYMTEERKQEVDAIRGEVGVKDVGRANAEDDLFGSGGEIVAVREEGKGFNEFDRVDLAKQVEKSVADDGRIFDQTAIDRGVALNASIILKDPTQILQTAEAIRKAAEQDKLDIQVVDWKTAAGIIGQFSTLVGAVLIIAIGIIFTVALVIINNSMITATMERTTEIGTMRAIGAQRSLVLQMFLLETLVLGAVAGSIGAAVGAGVVSMLGNVGIPATQDILVFMFAGPRLYPVFGASNLVIGFVTVFLVCILSTLYPARMATRIQPIVAMQRKE